MYLMYQAVYLLFDIVFSACIAFYFVLFFIMEYTERFHLVLAVFEVL